MRKRTHFLLVLIVVSAASIFSSYTHVKQAQNREGIILSPDKSKSVEIIEIGDSSQAIVNFHKRFAVGGSNLASISFDPDRIEFKWLDENNLRVTVRKGARLSAKEDEIYFLGETVKVEYITAP